jgi:antitoxin (DNA-binding transcriptional repressor) of toxin-antitoxin stability system
MKMVNFTELCKNASCLFSEVEKGQVLVVIRHGKQFAEVGPVSSATGQALSWKRPGLKLSAEGADLATAILEDRNREDLFASSDRKQLAAAKKAGLHTNLV